MKTLKPRRTSFHAIELASLQQFRALRGNAVRPEPWGGIS